MVTEVQNLLSESLKASHISELRFLMVFRKVNTMHIAYHLCLGPGQHLLPNMLIFCAAKHTHIPIKGDK